MIIVIRVCLAQCGHLVRAVIRIKTVSLASPGSPTLALIEIQDSADQNWCWWGGSVLNISAASLEFLFLTFQTSTRMEGLVQIKLRKFLTDSENNPDLMMPHWNTIQQCSSDI